MSLNESMATGAVKAKQQVLVENWSQRIHAVESAQEAPMTFEQKGNLAQLLENTNLAMKMDESTDAGATDGIKRFAMDLVTSVN